MREALSAPAFATTPELLGVVERGAAGPSSPVADAIVAALSSDLGSNLVGVIFYGSRLNRTAGPRSDWDFFVIVASYAAAHRSWFHARLNAVLPPSIYRREVTLADGSTAVCKLSFVSAGDLDRCTSSAAPDSYLFGRLSKRVALVFARDERSRLQLITALARSVLLCASWVLAEKEEGLPVSQVAQEGVAFSYRCEERVESPLRAQKLFDSDADHFRHVYQHAVAALVASGWIEMDQAGRAKRSIREVASRAGRLAAAALIRRSRRRARWRWLKNIVTFDGWDDYMLAKIERHQGLEISLSERERRHRVMAAIRYYLRLRRQGRLSGTARAERQGPANDAS